MKKLAIIGSGDLAYQIAHLAITDNHYIPIGYFDDAYKVGTLFNNLPVLGNLNEIEKVYDSALFDCIIIGIGYKHLDLRKKLYQRLSTTIPFGTIIHSSSVIDKSSHIGAGVVIYPSCSIDMKVTINDNSLINIGSIIAHDSFLGSHSFLSPGVRIAGFVKIGETVSLGIGTIVIDNIEIADNIRTGGGAVVINNLDKPGLYVGVPAVLKKVYK